MLFSKNKQLRSERAFVLEEKERDFNEDELVDTELSILPNWTDSIEQEYVLRFLNNENEPMKQNKISLSGIEINEDEDGGIIVTAFVRSSLKKAVTLESLPIILIGPEGERLASKVFDLSELGEIPPRTSRPWHFFFSPFDIYSSSIPKNGWRLAFEIQKNNR
ncbi:hypothetical protein B5V88_02670 [Heyndrickxia sporothermodurans]|uniref:SLAP domain-containing protein n=1 Tax=Heyndrickxia sporothermodurans TaxID=46224 RepID=A0A150L9Y4_9BACI|nr:SLAP domain-containing protein [Heyndrickxia sporothermodurans]KYD09148.1 hypothetical protein B4102_2675 [Heyndrickxia sporothermodurans]MBL5766683.1 SLAP domain-containing protein [Heyndrickxia sporothermodurans]MBL5770141.1 SLAP domain-containing protein [Heyndrickxia sporothermodurans]MBL5774258.1 SLAP domain-containing protein [Heyndrickxia sporothermodurans]MBL5777776.1 SLAP domain-containing protein [Heyndrickxia sporothermodurans]